MTHFILNRVQETTTSIGTGVLNLAGATSRMRSFLGAGGADAGTFVALIEHETAEEWELALVSFAEGSPNAITRDTVIESSNANAAVDFSPGTKKVSLTQLGGIRLERVRVVDSGSTTEMDATDCVVEIDKTVGGAHAAELPADAMPGQTFCVADGKGDAETNNITVTDPDGRTINGVSSIVLAANYERQWFRLNATGTKWLLA